MKITTLVPDANGAVNWPPFGKERKSVIAVGNFDGVHRGHQAVLARTVEIARSIGGTSVAILFEPRPEIVLAYAKAHDGAAPADPAEYHDPAALTGIGQRLKLIEDAGIDHAMVIRYDMKFAAMSYIFFLGQLAGKAGMHTLVLGTDARMGAGAKGDVKSIDRFAQGTRMFDLEVVDDRGPGNIRIPVAAADGRQIDDIAADDPALAGKIRAFGQLGDDGLTKAQKRAISKSLPSRPVRLWSSTYVRFLLSLGRCAQAAGILGRPHAVSGTVVHGEERGRTLGFPTANLGDIAGYVPADGVYAGWLVDEGPADLGTPCDELPLPGPGDGSASGTEAADEVASGAAAPADAAAADKAPEGTVTIDTARQPAPSYEPRRWPTAISIGTKETFQALTGLKERVLEANAIVENGEWIDLYGHRVRVEFAEFLRPQVRFESAEALVDELRRNVEQTKAICALA